MSLPRDVIVAALSSTMPPDVDVEPYARNIDPRPSPCVLVRVDSVVPTPDAPQAMRDYTFGVVIVPAHVKAGAVDDELDDVLEDVLLAIERAPDLTWTRADRGTYQDTTFPAYEVTLSAHITTEPQE